MELEPTNRVTISAWPKPVGLSPSVARFNVSISEYMRLNPSISGLIVGAIVFSGNEMLLIQRASHDFAPFMWEIPGGACEPNKDATVLHSLARELWEETGLHLRRVERHVDDVEFDDGRQHAFTWRKLTFEVEVDEGHDSEPAERKDMISAAMKLDPAEHQDWRWAQSADVEERSGGKGCLQFMDLQRDTILQAFKATK